MQVAAVEPQVRHLGRLPHIAQFALPGAGVFGSIGTQAPDFADFVGDFGRNEIGQPAVHRTVAGCVHDQVGGEFGAVGERHRTRVDALDAHATLELDTAVGHELRGADVDVV